jgi:putative transposase
MPRTARVAPKGHVYHVLTRGNNRQDVFRDDEGFRQYQNILLRYKEKFNFTLYHYVLMSNHVHLIIEPSEDGGGLSDIMKGINLSYAQYYKRRYNHIGHFWQDRYKSIIVSKDQYLIACGSYVELNPVRASIVEDPKDYAWSSYKVYAYGNKDVLVDEHPLYLQMAEEDRERRRKYREFVWGMLRDKDAMRGEMDRRIVYGNESFVNTLTKTLKISEIRKPVGRQMGWRKNKEK